MFQEQVYFRISAGLCHWLGPALKQHGLGTNVAVDFRAEQLKTLVT